MRVQNYYFFLTWPNNFMKMCWKSTKLPSAAQRLSPLSPSCGRQASTLILSCLVPALQEWRICFLTTKRLQIRNSRPFFYLSEYKHITKTSQHPLSFRPVKAMLSPRNSYAFTLQYLCFLTAKRQVSHCNSIDIAIDRDGKAAHSSLFPLLFLPERPAVWSQILLRFCSITSPGWYFYVWAY